jgi:DNA-binding transcriptional MerR regulator
MTKANLKRLEEGKLYYSISEVCAMTNLEQHVLRYWESEFPQLRPKKNRSGNRAYRAKEIKIIRYIKYLLYEEMYTIPGAKKKMADANMSDLDGQLMLLRVPAAAAPVQAAVPETESFKSAPEDTGSEIGTDGTENGSGNGTALGHPDYHQTQDASSSEAENSHSRDGGEAAARLREELKRVKQELQSLLSALAGPRGSAP